jgi:hypothetical protein
MSCLTGGPQSQKRDLRRDPQSHRDPVSPQASIHVAFAEIGQGFPAGQSENSLVCMPLLPCLNPATCTFQIPRKLVGAAM